MRFLLSVSLMVGASLVVHSQKSLKGILKKYNTESVPYIHIEESSANTSILYVDARKRKEYEVSHLKNALWVGYEQFDAGKVQKEIPAKDTEIVVYCSIGVRSEDIGEKLMKLGYTNVSNLYGGIFEWKNKGFPVYDDQGQETEKVHAFDAHWGKYLKQGEKVFDQDER